MEFEETDCLSHPLPTSPPSNSTPSIKSKALRHQSTINVLSLSITIVSLFCLMSKISKQDTTLSSLQSIVQTLIADLGNYKTQLEDFNKHRVANETLIKQSLTQNIQQLNDDTEKSLKALNKGFAKVKERLNKIIEEQHHLAIENQLIKSSYQSSTNKQSLPQTKLPTELATAASPQQLQKWKKDQRNTQITLSLLSDNQKEQFHEKKIEWMKSMLGQEDLKPDKRRTAFLSAQGNIHLTHHNALVDQFLANLYNSEHERLNTEYKLSNYQEELPFCLVVPTYNNAKNFRYEYNLQSILNLNYKNYKVIIIDDASTDGTPQLIQQFLSTQKDKARFQLIVNEAQMTAVPNIHRAVTKFCNEQDIIVLIDGDDELLGKQALKVFNAVYQEKGAGVVYSNHIKLQWHLSRAGPGWSVAYSDSEKKNNMYREVDQKISHLRSFKASLFLKIAEADLKDERGEWLRSTYDEVICLPILEMSCGKIEYIQEYFYLYNFGIGTNDLMVDGTLQKEVANYIKFQKPKYHCLKQE